jgi:LytS/YehU family sensor histidine kinase
MVARMNLPAMKPPPGWAGPRKFSVLSWALDLLAYSAIIGLAHSVHFYRRFREREHRALVLEASLVNARLNTLRAQLQPHFLFNSLNAIAALLRRDPRLAESTLMSLSELLRLALSQSERQEVALSEELALVQHYLEIQQTRFGDKLQVQQDIEPACQTCRIPTLLLQPLVENAIRHGLEPRETTGTVRLTAHRAGKRLVLSVEDNGVGLSENGEHQEKTFDAQTGNTTGTGIGLKNLRARLEALYGTEQKLELLMRPEGGVCVRVEVPWQETVEKQKIPSDAL